MFTDILTCLVSTTHALKMSHWSATGRGSHAYHANSAELADSLFEQTDTLIEALLSITSYKHALNDVVIQFPPVKFGSEDAGRELAVTQVRMLQKEMRKLDQWDDLATRSEILNIRDEILASIDKFLYKLRFE